MRRAQFPFTRVQIFEWNSFLISSDGCKAATSLESTEFLPRLRSLPLHISLPCWQHGQRPGNTIDPLVGYSCIRMLYVLGRFRAGHNEASFIAVGRLWFFSPNCGDSRCLELVTVTVTLYVRWGLPGQVYQHANFRSARGNIVAVVDVLIYLSLTIPPIFEV